MSEDWIFFSEVIQFSRVNLCDVKNQQSAILFQLRCYNVLSSVLIFEDLHSSTSVWILIIAAWCTCLFNQGKDPIMDSVIIKYCDTVTASLHVPLSNFYQMHS